MYSKLQQDLTSLAGILELVKQHGTEHLININSSPTTSSHKGLENEDLPTDGLGTEDTLKAFLEKYKSLMVATAGPRYLGFVTGGATPASIAGDWLTSIYDQNTFATSGNGDVSALIELDTVQLLLQLFKLPKAFTGGFVTGATMSNFTCLAVARQWAGKRLGIDVAKEGVSSPFKVLTATPHSSSIKSLAMLGMGSNNFIKLKVAKGNREAIDIEDLEHQLRKLNGESAIVISSGGTVNTVDFDDMNAISTLKEKYSFWWHIDAAFGAFAACSPKYRHLLSGWENADSITIDCHKWLNVPYDSAVFFVKDLHKQEHIETFQNSNAPYLGDPLANFTYLNFLPENSRRLRALPVWFSLLAYGSAGYQSIVENSIDIANSLGERIRSSDDFELLAPVRLNTVCFTLSKHSNDHQKIQVFLDKLTKAGKVFMTSTVYNGSPGIRAAFVNWRTTQEDLDIVWEELKRSLSSLNNLQD